MDVFAASGLFGLLFGFMFGVGCSLAVMYSIYMGGYRKAVRDAMAPKPPRRYEDAVRREKLKAASAD